jgi:glycosyltransferase involved in cell wall biosynthesis
MDYAPKEIIVVDDSTDRTPEIIMTYADHGVHLIHRDHNRNGCCGARNLGMQLAQGEVIVLLNADAMPSPDFLRRLIFHYQNGADFVVVRSQVLNRDNLWGKYIYAGERESLRKKLPMAWSEGFSLRRAAAESVGYIPGDFPIPFCRDYLLGIALAKAGFNKHVDLDIEMEHVVPDRLSTFWRNRVWRGTMSAPFLYFFRQRSKRLIFVREVLKAIRNFLKIFFILPHLIISLRRCRYLAEGGRNIPDLFVASVVDDVATSVGNLKGLAVLMQVPKLIQSSPR